MCDLRQNRVNSVKNGYKSEFLRIFCLLRRG